MPNLLSGHIDHEVQRLKDVHSLADWVCFGLKRLFQEIKQGSARSCRTFIEDFINRRGSSSKLRAEVAAVDHWLKEVAIAIEVPAMPKKEIRAADGTRLPSLSHMRTIEGAHAAAVHLFNVFNDYFWCKANHHDLPGFQAVMDPDPTQAVDQLLGKKLWGEIRSDLDDVAEFDVDRIVKAIKAESDNAIEFVQNKIIAALTDESAELDEFVQELDGWIKNGMNMKGKQLKLLECVIKGDMSAPLKDVKVMCDWENDDQFNSCKKAANKRLRKAPPSGWKLSRHNSHVILRQI